MTEHMPRRLGLFISVEANQDRGTGRQPNWPELREARAGRWLFTDLLTNATHGMFTTNDLMIRLSSDVGSIEGPGEDFVCSDIYKDEKYVSEYSCSSTCGIRAAIAMLASRARSGDCLWIYIACHGESRDNQLCLITQSTFEVAVPGTSISLSEIIACMQDSKALHRILVIDSCVPVSRLRDDHQPDDVAVLLAASPDQPNYAQVPGQGSVFVNALCEAAELRDEPESYVGQTVFLRDWFDRAAMIVNERREPRFPQEPTGWIPPQMDSIPVTRLRHPRDSRYREIRAN